MCLDSVTATGIVISSERPKTGYKVFQVIKGKLYPMCQEQDVFCFFRDTIYVANDHYIKTPYDLENNKQYRYFTGFHLFESLLDAESFADTYRKVASANQTSYTLKVQQVRYWGSITLGTQHGYDVIVASHMKLAPAPVGTMKLS